MFDTDRQTAQGRFHYRHRNPTPASLLKAKRFITVRDCSDGAIAIAIFYLNEWLFWIQCKCSESAIASMTVNPMQPISCNRQSVVVPSVLPLIGRSHWTIENTKTTSQTHL